MVKKTKTQSKAAHWDVSSFSAPALSHPQPQGRCKPFLTNMLAASTTGSKTERERNKRREIINNAKESTVNNQIVACIISTQA